MGRVALRGMVREAASSVVCWTREPANFAAPQQLCPGRGAEDAGKRGCIARASLWRARLAYFFLSSSFGGGGGLQSAGELGAARDAETASRLDLEGLRPRVDAGAGLLPRRLCVRIVSERLSELKRLPVYRRVRGVGGRRDRDDSRDHTLLLLVVSDLGVALHLQAQVAPLEVGEVTHGQRKVLSQGMALEAVVGEDAPQIWMANEEDAVEVVDLALIPCIGRSSAGEQANERRGTDQSAAR